MKYTHKPHEVEAIQYEGTDESYLAVLDFAAGYIIGGYKWRDAPKKLLLYTPHGPKKVGIGDFIIKHAYNEFVVEREKTFTESYEPSEEN